MTSASFARPAARPATTSANSVTGKSAGICCTSPSTRDCGSYSTITRASGRREDRAGELGLARAVAAHGIQVHAGLDHLRREDDRVALVGGDGGDDVGAARGLAGRGAAHDAQALEPQRGEVALELRGGRRVHVVEAQLADADQVMEGDRLELALRAVADQRHRAAVLARHPARGQRRHRGGAQRGGERELGEQDRVAGGDLGEHAERGDGEQALSGVLGVAVDVLERVQRAVGDRHQLDHADRGVRGVARRLVERVPAAVVRLDLARQRLDEGRRAGAVHQFLDALDACVVDHGSLPAWPVGLARTQCRAGSRPIKRQNSVQCVQLFYQIAN